MIATRTSGTAPLAVQFDATGTTVGSGNAFHDVTYEFNFGDDRGQNWSVSGQPKNIQRGGPLGAHVFDNPGTYNVRVRATASNGSYSETTVQVTVTDPASFYSGVQTICVSPSSNYTDCPSGAARQTALPSSYANKRVLLRSGESFGAINIGAGDDNAFVGAYGSGSKPRVASIGLGSSSSAWPDNITLMDLAVSDGFNMEATGSRVLLYRLDLSTPVTDRTAQVNIGTAATHYATHGSSGIYWPREIFLVENVIQGETSGDATPNITVMGWFMKSALLGNTINRATEHSLRMWAANKTLIAHNAIGGEHYAPGGVGIRQAIKIHASGLAAYTDSINGSLDVASSQVVIANNTIGSSNFQGSWLTGLAPQNADAGTVEGLEDFIAERNTFVRGPSTVSDIQWRGRRMTHRGNVTSGGGAASISRNGSAFDSRLATWDGPYLAQ